MELVLREGVGVSVGEGDAALGRVLLLASVVDEIPGLEGDRLCVADMAGLEGRGDRDLTAALDRPACLARAMTVHATLPIPLSEPS